MLKKMGAFVLVLVLACCFALAAGEEGTEEVVELNRLTTTGSTTVTMTVNNNRDSYIVVIPSKVEIDPVTQYGEGTITLKSGWTLISVNGLDVKLTKAANGVGTGISTSSYGSTPSNDITNNYFQNFTMKSDTGDAVTYAIMPSNNTPFTANSNAGGYSYSNNIRYGGTMYNTSLISVNKGGDNSTDQSVTLTFYVKTMPPAGIYSDTLTFSIVTR